MLSAYWGDPAGHHQQPATRLQPRGCSASTPGSTTRPTATATSSPGRCTTGAGWPLFARGQPGRRRSALQAALRRLELPAGCRRRHDRHRGAHAVERQPGIRAPEGGEGRGAGAHAARDDGHQQQGQPGRRPRLRRHRQEHAAQALGRSRSRSTCASSWRGWSAPSTWCWTTSTTARSKPVQIQFYRRRFAPAAGDHQRASWSKLRQVPGAVDVGLSEQDPQGRAEDRARPRPGQHAGHLGQRRGAGAARGLRRRRGGRLGRPDRRDRATWRCACTRTTASTPATSSACRSP